MSDSNPYFPVPPCEYGGWMEALEHGDNQAVWVLAEPHKIPLHNFYEFIWFLKTGGPRLWRMLTGKEQFKLDNKILREGYKHHTSYPRTQQFGQYTQRNPAIIDKKSLYKRVVGRVIRKLFTKGKDRKINKHYTFQGNLRNQGHGHGHGGGGHSSGYGYGHSGENYGFGQDQSGHSHEGGSSFGQDYSGNNHGTFGNDANYGFGQTNGHTQGHHNSVENFGIQDDYRFPRQSPPPNAQQDGVQPSHGHHQDAQNQGNNNQQHPITSYIFQIQNRLPGILTPNNVNDNYNSVRDYGTNFNNNNNYYDYNNNHLEDNSLNSQQQHLNENGNYEYYDGDSVVNTLDPRYQTGFAGDILGNPQYQTGFVNNNFNQGGANQFHNLNTNSVSSGEVLTGYGTPEHQSYAQGFKFHQQQQNGHQHQQNLQQQHNQFLSGYQQQLRQLEEQQQQLQQQQQQLPLQQQQQLPLQQQEQLLRPLHQHQQHYNNQQQHQHNTINIQPNPTSFSNIFGLDYNNIEASSSNNNFVQGGGSSNNSKGLSPASFTRAADMGDKSVTSATGSGRDNPNDNSNIVSNQGIAASDGVKKLPAKVVAASSQQKNPFLKERSDVDASKLSLIQDDYFVPSHWPKVKKVNGINGNKRLSATKVGFTQIANDIPETVRRSDDGRKVNVDDGDSRSSFDLATFDPELVVDHSDFEPSERVFLVLNDRESVDFDIGNFNFVVRRRRGRGEKLESGDKGEEGGENGDKEDVKSGNRNRVGWRRVAKNLADKRTGTAQDDNSVDHNTQDKNSKSKSNYSKNDALSVEKVIKQKQIDNTSTKTEESKYVGESKRGNTISSLSVHAQNYYNANSHWIASNPDKKLDLSKSYSKVRVSELPRRSGLRYVSKVEEIDTLQSPAEGDSSQNEGTPSTKFNNGRSQRKARRRKFKKRKGRKVGLLKNVVKKLKENWG